MQLPCPSSHVLQVGSHLQFKCYLGQASTSHGLPSRSVLYARSCLHSTLLGPSTFLGTSRCFACQWRMLCTCRGVHGSIRWDADVPFPRHVLPGKQQGHRQPSQIVQLAGADVSYMSAEGRIEPSDGTLMCSYHGWRFQGDGKCTTVPQTLNSNTNTAACSSARSCASTRPTQVSSPYALKTQDVHIPSACLTSLLR